MKMDIAELQFFEKSFMGVYQWSLRFFSWNTLTDSISNHRNQFKKIAPYPTGKVHFSKYVAQTGALTLIQRSGLVLAMNSCSIRWFF